MARPHGHGPSPKQPRRSWHVARKGAIRQAGGSVGPIILRPPERRHGRALPSKSLKNTSRWRPGRRIPASGERRYRPNAWFLLRAISFPLPRADHAIRCSRMPNCWQPMDYNYPTGKRNCGSLCKTRFADSRAQEKRAVPRLPASLPECGYCTRTCLEVSPRKIISFSTRSFLAFWL